MPRLTDICLNKQIFHFLNDRSGNFLPEHCRNLCALNSAFGRNFYQYCCNMDFEKKERKNLFLFFSFFSKMFALCAACVHRSEVSIELGALCSRRVWFLSFMRCLPKSTSLRCFPFFLLVSLLFVFNVYNEMKVVWTAEWNAWIMVYMFFSMTVIEHLVSGFSRSYFLDVICLFNPQYGRFKTVALPFPLCQSSLKMITFET